LKFAFSRVPYGRVVPTGIEGVQRNHDCEHRAGDCTSSYPRAMRGYGVAGLKKQILSSFTRRLLR